MGTTQRQSPYYTQLTSNISWPPQPGVRGVSVLQVSLLPYQKQCEKTQKRMRFHLKLKNIHKNIITCQHWPSPHSFAIGWKKKRKWFYILFFDVDSILKGGEKGTDCALNKWKLMTCQMRANTIWKMYLLGKLPHYIEIWMESNETNFHYLHVFLFQLLLDMNHFPYIRLTPKVCVFCLWLGTALAIVSI